MAEVRNLRVMTFNIHWGEGTDGNYDMCRIANVINEQNVDVACLQEVHRQTDKFNEDQAMVLGEMTGMHVYFGETMTGYPQDRKSGGRYGNVILSLEEGDHLTYNFTPGTGWSISQEPRGAHALKLEGVTVINTHLGCDITGTEQKVSASELVGFASVNGDGALVLCGDMNSFPMSDASRHLRRQLTDVWEELKYGKTTYLQGCTMPAWVPFQRIDHILYRGVTPLSVDVVDTSLECGSHPSDHLPVVAEFRVGEVSS